MRPEARGEGIVINAIFLSALFLAWCMFVLGASVGGALTVILFVGMWFEPSAWPEFIALFFVTTILIAISDMIFNTHYKHNN